MLVAVIIMAAILIASDSESDDPVLDSTDIAAAQLFSDSNRGPADATVEARRVFALHQGLRDLATDKEREVSDADVAGWMSAVEARCGCYRNAAALEAWLKKAGTSAAQVREFAAGEVIRQRVEQRVGAEAAQPSDAQVKAYYAANKHLYSTPQRRVVLLIKSDSLAASKASLRRINSGDETFEVLSQTASTDASAGIITSLQSDDLRRGLVKPAFALKKGQIAGPIAAGGGYWLIKAIGPLQKAETPTFTQITKLVRQNLLDARRADLVTAFYRDKLPSLQPAAQAMTATTTSPDASAPPASGTSTR